MSKLGTLRAVFVRISANLKNILSDDNNLCSYNVHIESSKIRTAIRGIFILFNIEKKR